MFKGEISCKEGAINKYLEILHIIVNPNITIDFQYY